MKKRIIIDILLLILVLLFGITTMINTLTFDKNDNNVSETQIEPQITSETTTTSTTTTTTTKTTKKTTKTTYRTTTKNVNQNTSGGYKLTHYGPDCSGCSGTTASGYNVRNTIYYNDNTYGKIRVVAMRDLPLYSVIKIKNYRQSGDIIAIVLDKPKYYGIIDLLVESEKKSSQLGIQKNVQIEILRKGK